MTTLSRRETQALELIDAYWSLTGKEGPSVSWLARALGVSRARARALVDVLHTRGFLRTATPPLIPVPLSDRATQGH